MRDLSPTQTCLEKVRKTKTYLSLGVSRREDAKECLADECVESLCASLRSRKYSRSPVTLNGVGVIRAANGGSGTNSTQDSAIRKKNLLFHARCLSGAATIPWVFPIVPVIGSDHFSMSSDANNAPFSHARKILSHERTKENEQQWPTVIFPD